jgi:hypothetical protein
MKLSRHRPAARLNCTFCSANKHSVSVLVPLPHTVVVTKEVVTQVHYVLFTLHSLYSLYTV